MAQCICDFPSSCGGTRMLACDGCGGDNMCICAACFGNGETECDGCEDCGFDDQDEDDDYADEPERPWGDMPGRWDPSDDK